MMSGKGFVFLMMVVVLVGLGGCHAAKRDVAETPRNAITSPDGTIEVRYFADGPLAYSVSIDGKPLLEKSLLSLQFADGTTLGRDVRLRRTEIEQVERHWENPLGKRRKVVDRYIEIRLLLEEKSAENRPFEVLLRAYDDGVAVRYVLPALKSGDQDFAVNTDMTQFAFAGDATCFAGSQKGGFKGSQEWEFERRKLSDLKAESIAGLPVLVQAEHAWVAIAESDLRNWAGMWIGGTGGPMLTTKLSPPPAEHAVRGKFPAQSPWRVVMIGREAGRLIESDLILNLASPCELADASWVKPGMMAWDCWWSKMGKMDTATMKEFVSFASEMGWPYQLVDGGWYGKSNDASADVTKATAALDMPELLRFAKEKKVRLWVWLFWTDLERNHSCEEVFAQYEKWGIAGVKVDFMDRDDQEMVNWYEKITKAAAAHHLMVNFHGAYKPTGMNRTFPNQVTREGILGNEYNRWSARVTPEHKLMLPFTRFLVGPGDFTPGGFVNRQPEGFNDRLMPVQVQGTRAMELGLFVAYDSPVMCVADHPSHLRGAAGVDFLKGLPTVWDDTRVLAGEPGKFLTIARRSGETWYLAHMRAGEGGEETVGLDFLPEGKYEMALWHDTAKTDSDAGYVEKEVRTVEGREKVRVHVARNSGFVARIIRQR